MAMLSRLVLGVCASLLVSAVALAQHGAVVHVPADKAAAIMQKGGQVAAAPDATVSFNRMNGPVKEVPKSVVYYTVKAIRP